MTIDTEELALRWMTKKMIEASTGGEDNDNLGANRDVPNHLCGTSELCGPR